MSALDLGLLVSIAWAGWAVTALMLGSTDRGWLAKLFIAGLVLLFSTCALIVRAAGG